MEQVVNPLEKLVSDLTQQNDAKKDYVLPQKLIHMNDDFTIEVNKRNGGMYVPNEVLHQHFAEKLGIPANYYKRMQLELPELLAANVNRWLQKNGDKNVLLRTFEHEDLGNIGRGLLSDRYSMIDNYDVLFAALAAIKDSGLKVDIKNTDITNKRMYVNIIAPEIEVIAEEALRGYLKDSPVGYGILAGLSLSNSEVGYGSYELKGRALIKKCMNGLIAKDDAFRKIHLGAKMNEGQVNWSEKTQKKNIELIQSQTSDAIKHFLSEGFLNGVVQKLTAAKNVDLNNPVDALHNVVREIAKTVTVSEESKKNILNYFVKDGDTAASGVFQALTREAQNLDADSRFDMEQTAFDMLPKIKSFDHPFVAGKN